MRRVLLLLTLVALTVPIGLPAEAGLSEHTAVLRKVRVFTGGAAGEATYDVVCQSGDGFVTLSLGLHQDGHQYIARGKVSPVPCTGEVERIVIPLQSAGDGDLRRIKTGAATVEQLFTNLVEGCDPCFDELSSVPATVVAKPFITPYDQDLRADLTLVRSRLTDAGGVRVVYDLTCDGPQFSTSPVSTTITQVTPRGRLVFGTASRPVGEDVNCDSDPQRYRFMVEATAGRFRPGKSFIGTRFGSAYEWGVFADDQHPLKLTS